jgi:hypothetical protein
MPRVVVSMTLTVLVVLGTVSQGAAFILCDRHHHVTTSTGHQFGGDCPCCVCNLTGLYTHSYDTYTEYCEREVVPCPDTLCRGSMIAQDGMSITCDVSKCQGCKCDYPTGDPETCNMCQPL